jgi:hypothetical protein
MRVEINDSEDVDEFLLNEKMKQVIKFFTLGITLLIICIAFIFYISNSAIFSSPTQNHKVAMIILGFILATSTSGMALVVISLFTVIKNKLFDKKIFYKALSTFFVKLL